MSKPVSSLIVLAVFCCVSVAIASDQAADKAAIEKTIDSYVAAFNAQDAATLAAHWCPDAIYINPLSGQEVEGRDAIEKEFKSILAELKEARLEVDVTSIRFISPSVAVENGVAKLVSANGDPKETSYTAIHVKKGGQWLLDRVTEEEVPVVLSHYERLKQLEWMIGSWGDAGNQEGVETTFQWTRNKNYIVRSFAVSVRDRIDNAGMQIIGWDAKNKQIRSWIFDSDGGFAEGRWTKKDNRWFINTSGTTPNGLTTTSVNIITQVDDNEFSWQSVNRVVDGELLPNVDEVVVARRPNAE